ncbi:Hypothetical predicted protein [Podarcis lilfordi]|uniref:Uncharacterized protein n=1 Tax=Podarcis lilfordi TaxID=74358 RepID=A0AA35KMX4_9SAUR|nr:Hypothetical predicted protein [Podarcis lilfordi]
MTPVAGHTTAQLQYSKGSHRTFLGTPKLLDVPEENTASMAAQDSINKATDQAATTATPPSLKVYSKWRYRETPKTETQKDPQVSLLARIRQNTEEAPFWIKRLGGTSTICCTPATGSASSSILEGTTMRGMRGQDEADGYKTRTAVIQNNQDLGHLAPSQPDNFKPSPSSGPRPYQPPRSTPMFTSPPMDASWLVTESNTSTKGGGAIDHRSPVLVFLFFLFLPLPLCILCWLGARSRRPDDA